MTAIELFCCSGGMAEGFRRAGITFAEAFDHDANACNSYEKNLGHRPVQMDIRDLGRLASEGWTPPELDLVVADPPCTPWSRAGKREGLGDQRDMLRETVKLLELLRPRCWLIGNVPGLDDSPNLSAVQRTIGRLSATGYCVDYAKLDAADYGVPQHRVRPFWFGHLRDTQHISWPARTHGDPRELRNVAIPGCELLPWVTCRDALGHLSVEELGKPIMVRAWKRDHRPSDIDAPARTVTRNTHGDGSLLAHPKHPINRLDEPSFAVTARDRGGAQGACAMEWPWDRPATTVQADPRIAPPGHHYGGSYLSAAVVDRPATTITARDEMSVPGRSTRVSQSVNAIKLSERAGATLQSFPDGWTFSGKTKRARWAQIGMAMPPGLAEPVARSIVRWFAAHQAAACETGTR